MGLPHRRGFEEVVAKKVQGRSRTGRCMGDLGADVEFLATTCPALASPTCQHEPTSLRCRKCGPYSLVRSDFCTERSRTDSQSLRLLRCQRSRSQRLGRPEWCAARP